MCLIDEDFKNGLPLTLAPTHCHYLKTVLRRQEGDFIRVFNGIDGEYTAEITTLGKKTGTTTLVEKLKDQPTAAPHVHLLFAPIKKARLEILIEKAVELGVTDLHPVLTMRTENRKLNIERLRAQIIEAAEQCERLDIPQFHAIQKLETVITKWDKTSEIFWANERGENTPLNRCRAQNYAFLIGPEGGFTNEEAEMLYKVTNITPISLGKRIYRAETAAMLCLSHATLNHL